MRVLFICASNVNRSQIAEAFLRFYLPYVDAKSCGAHPPPETVGIEVGHITPDGIRAMHELGIALQGARVKGVSPELVRGADHVISMVPREELPAYVLDAPDVRMWDIPDPGGKPYEVLIKTRDAIQAHVRALAEELASPRALAAFCVLATPSGKVLLQHRTADAPTNPGRWQLFGGACEGGESPRETLARELREELAISIEPRAFEYLLSVAIDPLHSVEIYVARIPDDMPVALGEGDGYRYVEQRSLSDFDTEPNTRAALARFYANLNL